MAEIPDYSLGRAHGKIDIEYDGSGADKAARDLDKVAAEAQKTDASLSKTQGTLKDTEKEFDKAGSTAENYSKKIRDVDQAHAGLHASHKQSSSDLQDFSRDAQKGENAAAGMANAVHDVARAAELLQPELAGAAELIDTFAEGLGRKLGGAVGGSGQSLRDFGKHIADFEKSIAKISGTALAVPSLAGLGGLAGGAGIQGLTAMIDSVRQLSGGLGLLPAAISGVGFSLGTLKIAFHGVSDAIKDMMADDPKKFLDDIKNMGPAAAQAMLGIAQFRDQFKLAGAAVQDSFFKQISTDIAPLIQTWLPAITSGMSKIATVFGQAAHEFAGLLGQPAMMQAFQSFVSNLATGLQALQPAIAPLLDIFTRLTTVGSGFFGEIGQRITQMMGFFDQIVSKAQASGQLQQWIQTGIDAFSRLVNIAYLVGSTFNTIFDVAEKFGGGGFLGWLQQVTGQFDAWTKSAAGQNVLQQFFSTTQQAMTAFAPMIQPIAQGITSLLTAFTKLGIGIAPGWQTFFNTFAQTMGQLGPVITGMAPAINQFLTGMSQAFAQLMASVGPQLPTIFAALSNAFVALLPQIQPLVSAFLELVEQVGPQLPQFFGQVTQLIQSMIPFLPIVIGLVRDFVSALSWFVGAGAGVINWFTGFLGGISNFVSQVPAVFGQLIDGITGFFKGLPGEAEQWGKDLINGFIGGIKSLEGDVENVVKSITDHIPEVVKKALGISSPSKVFYEIGVNTMQGLQGGLAAASAGAVAVTSGVAQQIIGTMGSGLAGVGAAAAASSLGGAPAPAAGGSDTTGQALLPNNIASADTSILRAYQNHKFDDKRGLKGLAASLGQGMQLAQTGFNLMNQYIIQSVVSGMGMMPGAKDPSWRKMTPAQQAANLQATADKSAPKTTWGDVLGQGSPGAAATPQQTPLGVTAASSKDDIQKAIIAAGKQRGMSDSDIQTALAVAAAESGFNASSPTQMQGGHPVGGLFQQGPAFGTADQALDPNHAINAFYNTYAQQLAKNPTNPLLAAVLTQNPQLGSGAQGSKYMQDVQNQLGLAGSILNAPGNKNITGPSWAQVAPGPPATTAGGPGGDVLAQSTTGAQMRVSRSFAEQHGYTILNDLPSGSLPVAPPDKIKVGQDGSISVPPGYAMPAASTAGGAISANPASRASQISSAPNVESGIQAAGGLPTLYPTSGANAYQVPAWAQQLASAFGLTASTYASGGSLHQMGYAFDFNAPGNDPTKLQGFAQFVQQHLASQTLQLIYQNAQSGQKFGIASGQEVGPGTSQPGYYAGDFGGHTDHVHFATDQPVLFNGQVPPGSMVGASGDPSGGLVAANGKTLDQLTDNTGKSATANDRLLQAYLQGNPALAGQISAAQAPGASDTTVLGALNGIGKTIDGLKTQDAVGNKQTIEALSSTQSDIASQQGFSSGQSNVSAISGALSGASGAISGAFQVAQGVLDAATATQDIADRLVYGVANTEDVMKLIDDTQKYIAVAADVANETGNVLNTAGGIAAAAGSSPGGGSPGGALQAAGSIASLIGSGLQGVNAAIDYGQQIYEIAMNYFGQFMSFLDAGPGGRPLMGNVQYMLNTNTGKLITSSLDNPQLQNQLTVPQFLQGLYGIGQYGPNGGAATNPGVGALNIYAGPGQSTADMMNQAMWQVNTGNVGAAVAANF